MDVKTTSSAISMIKQILDPRSATSPVIISQAQKPGFVPSEIAQPFPRKQPHEAGIPDEWIERFIDILGRDETLDMHRVIVIKDGCVIAEHNYGAYDSHIWHISHSECKSITGLAIGIAISEGLLRISDKLTDIFKGKTPLLSQLTHKDITIAHLLTMTSGILFNEAGSVTESNWIKCFMDSNVLSEPGKKFNYNSMNTYMLSAVLREVTGMSLTAYLTPRIFEPLGITNFFWETCPAGIEKGGWGLYMLPEDMAKIGQLVLNGGRWQDKQLVPEAWIRAAASAQVQTPETYGLYDYGYQIWVGRDSHTFLFNGMFGQNVLGDPASGMLILSNAGNNEFFQQSNFYAYAETLLHDCRLLLSPDAAKKEKTVIPVPDSVTNGPAVPLRNAMQPKGWLASLLRPLRDSQQTKAEQRFVTAINGLTLRFTSEQKKECAAAVGIYPLFSQAVQNLYSSGLEEISFSKQDDGTLLLKIREKKESFSIPAGFDAPVYSEITCGGEPQRIAARIRLTSDEQDNPVLSLRISFLEISSARMIRFTFRQEDVLVKWTESPGSRYLLDSLESMRASLKNKGLIASILNFGDADFLAYKIKSVLEPEFSMTAVPPKTKQLP